MKGFKNVLLFSAVLYCSSPNILASDKTYSSREYYPLVEGASWTYSIPFSRSNTTEKSIASAFTVNGQNIYVDIESDRDGSVESWISNDQLGVGLHRQISSPSETGTGVDTVTYTPALPLLPETWAESEVYNFTGAAEIQFPGYAPISVNYNVVTTVGSEGEIGVTSGRFNVVPVTYKISLVDTVSGEAVADTLTMTLWLAKDIGPVKMQSNLNGLTETFNLSSWSFPGSGDELSRAIYWRNRLTGANWYHQMDQAQISDSHLVDRVEDANWKLVAIADFNGDGEEDLLWRHQVTGTNWMYLMQDGKVQESRYVNQVSDLNWMVAGAADLTGDGKADVVLRHTQTGLNWLYTMNGNQITANQKIDQVTTDWFIAGLGDFNGDGMADILWRNPHSGINWLYTMNGAAIESSKKLSTTAPEWDVAGVADFDDNGVSDVLWRNNQTGLNWLYLMDANGITTNSRLNVVQDTNWQVKALGDYDQDGHADIYWRNLVTGKNWIYFMNGNQIKQSSGVNAVSPEWEIQ